MNVIVAEVAVLWCERIPYLVCVSLVFWLQSLTLETCQTRPSAVLVFKEF